MLTLKRIVFTMCTLGMYTMANASMENTNNVTIPVETKGWSFGMDALYVRTNNISDVTSMTSVNLTDTGGIIYNLNQSAFPTDWQWGFRMALSYYWGNGTDMNVNWTHFVHSASSSTTAEPVVTSDSISSLQGLFLFKGGNLTSAEAINTVATSVGNNFDAVNFEWGQLTHWGSRVDTRLYAGLQYASIRQTVTQTGWNNIDSNVYDQTNMQSQFDGIGPRIGVNTSYNIVDHVSLFGNVALGILVGDLSFNSSQVFTEDESSFTSGKQENLSGTNDNEVAPEVEAELGVRYTHSLAQGDLSAEVGYTVANYWNAAAIVSDSTYNGGYMAEDVTNFNYEGLVFGLKWRGDL